MNNFLDRFRQNYQMCNRLSGTPLSCNRVLIQCNNATTHIQRKTQRLTESHTQERMWRLPKAEWGRVASASSTIRNVGPFLSYFRAYIYLLMTGGFQTATPAPPDLPLFGRVYELVFVLWTSCPVPTHPPLARPSARTTSTKSLFTDPH